MFENKKKKTYLIRNTFRSRFRSRICIWNDVWNPKTSVTFSYVYPKLFFFLFSFHFLGIFFAKVILYVTISVAKKPFVGSKFSFLYTQSIYINRDKLTFVGHWNALSNSYVNCARVTETKVFKSNKKIPWIQLSPDY